MAVFEVWDIKGRYDHPINYATNEEKTNKKNFTDSELSGMQDVIRYAANSSKTTADDLQVYVTGINCNPVDARNQMANVRKQYNDSSEIICYHGFQSFAHGEVDPDTAHEIGIEFAKKMWGERFQVIVTTHLNTKSIHNHFVINGTSFEDGKRFYDNKQHLRNARATSDDFCRSYGLSIIENPSGKKIPNHIYKDNKAGLPTRLNVIKEAIDEAIKHSFTRDDFFKQMKSMGYSCDFRESRKYATVTGAGYEKPLRIHRIGPEYTKEFIYKRISQNKVSVKGIKESPALKKVGYRNVTAYSIYIAKQKGGLRGLYLHYSYLLGILPKNTQRNNARLHYLLKEDLLKVDRISEQTKLLHKYHIGTMQELLSFKENLTTESASLEEQRNKLWNKSRSIKDPEKMADIKEQIAKCSARLKDIRKEVKHINEIIERAPVIEQKIAVVEKEEQEKLNRKEKTKDESFRRRS